MISAIEHLDKRADAGAQLFCVGVGVVGLQAQHGHTGFLEGAGDSVLLGVVEAAELQVAVDDTVDLVLLDQTQDVVDAAGVRGEAGAVGLHVALGQCHELLVQARPEAYR